MNWCRLVNGKRIDSGQPEKKQCILEEEEGSDVPFLFFRKAERPDQTDTVVSYRLTWMYIAEDRRRHHVRTNTLVVSRNGLKDDTVRISILLARPRVLHGPQHAFFTQERNDTTTNNLVLLRSIPCSLEWVETRPQTI